MLRVIITLVSMVFQMKDSTKKEYVIQLRQDVQLIKEKLDGIVPEHRIPE